MLRPLITCLYRIDDNCMKIETTNEYTVVESEHILTIENADCLVVYLAASLKYGCVTCEAAGLDDRVICFVHDHNGRVIYQDVLVDLIAKFGRNGE